MSVSYMSVAIGKEAVEVGGILSQFVDVRMLCLGGFFMGDDQTPR